jgi:hypothetical protein
LSVGARDKRDDRTASRRIRARPLAPALLASCDLLTGVSELDELPPGEDGGARDATTLHDSGTREGAADARQDAAEGPCSPDLSTDPSACVGGACQSFALAPGSAHGLAVDDTNVYYTDISADTVNLCRLTGCGGAPTILARNVNSNAISAGPTAVFFSVGYDTAPGVVYTCPIATGCSGAPKLFFELPAGDMIGRVLVANDLVYFDDSTTGESYDCPLTGCPTAGPTLLASTPGGNPDGLASDAKNLYWADLAGAIYPCPLAGCMAGLQETSVPGTTPRSVAVGAGSVFWADDTDPGDVRSKLIGSSGSPSKLVLGRNVPLAVAVDDTFLYWTDNGSSEVWKADLTGASSTMLASGQTGVFPIVVTSTAIYWGNQGADAGGGRGPGAVEDERVCHPTCRRIGTSSPKPSRSSPLRVDRRHQSCRRRRTPTPRRSRGAGGAGASARRRNRVSPSRCQPRSVSTTSARGSDCPD